MDNQTNLLHEIIAGREAYWRGALSGLKDVGAYLDEYPELGWYADMYAIGARRYWQHYLLARFGYDWTQNRWLRSRGKRRRSKWHRLYKCSPPRTWQQWDRMRYAMRHRDFWEIAVRAGEFVWQKVETETGNWDRASYATGLVILVVHEHA